MSPENPTPEFSLRHPRLAAVGAGVAQLINSLRSGNTSGGHPSQEGQEMVMGVVVTATGDRVHLLPNADDPYSPDDRAHLYTDQPATDRPTGHTDPRVA